jgi:hypothetical protein
VSWQVARLRVKDAAIWRGRVGLILVVGASVVCRIDSFRDAFAAPRETLRVIGPRLSRCWSEGDLSAIASRDAAILDLLEPAERRALGRGYLRSRRTLSCLMRSESWYPGGVSEAWGPDASQAREAG